MSHAAFLAMLGAGTPVIRVLDFTTLTPGAVTLPAGLSFSRASAATVQTGTSTVVTAGITTDVARVFSDGTHRGLLVEESRVNSIPDSRDMLAASWNGGVATVARFAGACPDGATNTAVRTTATVGQYGNYKSIAGSQSITFTGSAWQRHATSSGPFNMNVFRGANQGVWGTASTAWERHVYVATATVSPAGIDPVDGRDIGNGATACDIVSDLNQIEAGAFATSAIVTSGGVGTRAADLLYFPASAGIRSGGALRLDLAFYPEAASSAYGADQHLWWVDANNGAKIVQSTRKITVTLGGVAYVLPVAIPAWSALDTVRIYVECGGIATSAWVSINGTVTFLGFAAAGSAVPAGNVYLLNNSTAGVLSAVLASVTVLR